MGQIVLKCNVSELKIKFNLLWANAQSFFCFLKGHLRWAVGAYVFFSFVFCVVGAAVLSWSMGFGVFSCSLRQCSFAQTPTSSRG